MPDDIHRRPECRRMKSTVTRAALAAILAAVSIFPAAAQTSKPDLIVLIAIDQFGSQLFNKWRGSFTGGLKRLANEGLIYSNAFQSHGVTETCAGHSTLLTGKQPGHTGIVANEWYDTQAGKTVYCVADDRYTDAHDAKARKVGPGMLVTSTLGDWLKEQQPLSRTVVVSGKDRASLTMAGHRAEAVFWYEDNVGFTTSVLRSEDSAAKLAPLATLNARIKAEAGKAPPWTYTNEACRSLEGEYKLGNVTWRSKLPPEIPGKDGEPPKPARALHIMDPLTAEAARQLIAHYQLGQRGVTDLLAVGFSATDFVGHGYGTQGPEMCDQMSRLDALLNDFLTFLDGLGRRVVVVVTGDHGGSDFAERLAAQGYSSAKRIDGKVFLASVNDELKRKLSLTADPLVSPDMVQFYAVDERGRKMSEPMRAQVIAAAIDAFKARPEIEDAFALTDLLKHKVTASAPSDYSLRDRFSRSAMEGRSGDILLAFKSGVSTSRILLTGFIMAHAGPYAHDTAVPIIYWWRGAKAQTRLLPIDTTSIAPTLANISRIKPPAGLDGACLDLGYPGAPACSP